jgi:queuine tRNA-ribosyltransferase
MTIDFKLLARDGVARRGVLNTAHGPVNTPAFMPVGTQATVKGMLPESVAATGAEILLGNTYHLMLRPGAERVAHLGGLHRFMNWSGPILTDSGGFQVMSLSGLRSLDDDGVTFRSHLDGSSHRLTPERSIEIQNCLDADITMCFDECTPWPATEAQAAHSMRLSMRWARRCREAFVDRPGYGLFGIVQGSVYPALRAESAAALTALGFDGYAVGGLAVGEGQELMLQTLDSTVPLLPTDRPRYLMGVGRPSDIVAAVRRGIDMFDCVMPTRSGRTGQGFTRRGTVNIRNARHADDPRPLDSECRCPACRSYGRAYLHHLFRANEMLGPILLTWHNLAYFQDLMAGLRDAIEAGRLADFAAAFEHREAEGDLESLVAVDAADDEPVERPDRGPDRGQGRSQNRNHNHTRNQDRDDD